MFVQPFWRVYWKAVYLDTFECTCVSAYCCKNGVWSRKAVATGYLRPVTGTVHISLIRDLQGSFLFFGNWAISLAMYVSLSALKIAPDRRSWNLMFRIVKKIFRTRFLLNSDTRNSHFEWSHEYVNSAVTGSDMGESVRQWDGRVLHKITFLKTWWEEMIWYN